VESGYARARGLLSSTASSSAIRRRTTRLRLSIVGDVDSPIPSNLSRAAAKVHDLIDGNRLSGLCLETHGKLIHAGMEAELWV
jgi:hypothetical protein